jgi:Cu/Ag efflux protein CusF
MRKESKKEDKSMMSIAKSRFAWLGVVVLVGCVLAAGTATAQSQRPMSPPPGAGAPGGPAERMSTGILEGSVKEVDPGAGTVHVSSGPLGVLGKTLEVTDSTQIQVEGRKGTLADIREGAQVKASYESHDGKNVATRIDVTPAAKKQQ